jgi:hypothetical protein
VLAHLPQLRTLYIDSQQKDIDVLSELHGLEDVTLRSVSTGGLDYLHNLKKLWSIDLKLGGITDLSALTGMRGVKYLELWQIKGLSDISAIAQMPGLQYLFLQSLKNVRQLPDLSALKSLRRIHLDTMKGLKDLTALNTAPAFEEFVHLAAQGMRPGDYLDILKTKTLKRALVGFGSEKKNIEFRRLMDQHGIAAFAHAEFSFK